jgi:polar amino acid transport system permease protein
LAKRQSLVQTSLVVTEFMRNIPTFVFLFYLAFLIPVEFEFSGQIYVFPAWLKAALALSVAVVGFVSDNLYVAWRHWREGDHAAALLFIPSWTGYLLIIVMASSTASVIGVDEIVARCNVIIAAVGRDELMLWIYLYAIGYFVLFCFPLSRAMEAVKNRMQTRARSALSKN